MKPLVSVCISTFNRCEQLEVAIQSILKQDYPNIELVIYDNASSDNTSGCMRGQCEYFGKLRFYYASVPNPNAMETLNWTFNNANGDYILVLDDDAYLPETDVISKLVEVIESDDRIAIVGANVKGSDGVWQMPIRTPSGVFAQDWQIDMMGTFEYFEFHGACALFRKSLVTEFGTLYDESFIIYMNELDLATRVMAYGYKVMICSNAIAIHQGVGDKNACNKRAYYFMKNYNTVLTRNFRTVTGRLKAVLLHTFMSSGYYAERILIHKTCKSRFTIFKFGYYVIKLTIESLYRSLYPDKRYVYDSIMQRRFEQSMYNGFKNCIVDRMFWFLKRKPTTIKGVR